MAGRERTRDRLKRLVFRNQTASSKTSLQPETASGPSSHQADPIGSDQPNSEIGRQPVPPGEDVQLSASTSGELQNTGLPMFSTPEVQSTQDPIGPNQTPIVIETQHIPPVQEATLSNLASGEPRGAEFPASSSNDVQNGPVGDLWSEAREKLPEKDKSAVLKLWLPLQTDSWSPTDMPQRLISLVEKKRDECEEKRWKFKFNGRQIILRDVAEKVIVWINKFKEIGDIAVNFDPVHAALPWAGVRFLLQVRVVSDYQRVKIMLVKTVVADSQQMGALLIGLDTITNFINRCRIYEILYLSDRHAEKAGQVSQACLNLEVALVKLYATMLQFLASSNVLYDSNVGARVVCALLEPNKVTDLVDRCEKLQSHVDVEANNCNHTHSRVAHAKIADLERLLGDLTAPIFRTDRQVTKLWERLEDSRRTKILTWTSSIPYEDNHYTARQGHVGSTGEWLLKHEMYREWRGSSASMILWLHGIRKCLH